MKREFHANIQNYTERKDKGCSPNPSLKKKIMKVFISILILLHVSKICIIVTFKEVVCRVMSHSSVLMVIKTVVDFPSKS